MRRGGSRQSAGFDLVLGNRLRQERELAGASRDALARVAGVSEQKLAEYERGEKPIPPGCLAAATLALGVSLSLLFYEIYEGEQQRSGFADAENDRWITIYRPPGILVQPAFSQAAPLVKLWQETRGGLTDEVRRAITAHDMPRRMYLLRRSPRSSRLVTEHCAWGVTFLRPCEALRIIGRDFHDMPDREYGAWIEEAYSEALWSHSLRVNSVRALIRIDGHDTAHALRSRAYPLA